MTAGEQVDAGTSSGAATEAAPAGTPAGAGPSHRGLAKGPRAGTGLDWGDLYGHVQMVISRMTVSRRLDPQVGEDALQEAFLRLLEARCVGKTVNSPKRWLLHVARNLLDDTCRQRHVPIGPVRERQGSADGAVFSSLASDDAGPEDAAILKDIWEASDALLARLPPPYREVAQRQLVSGQSRKEIIAWLGLAGTVGVQACRAILRRTHAMLLHLAEGGDPRDKWPGRYNPNKIRGT